MEILHYWMLFEAIQILAMVWMVYGIKSFIKTDVAPILPKEQIHMPTAEQLMDDLSKYLQTAKGQKMFTQFLQTSGAHVFAGGINALQNMQQTPSKDNLEGSPAALGNMGGIGSIIQGLTGGGPGLNLGGLGQLLNIANMQPNQDQAQTPSRGSNDWGW